MSEEIEPFPSSCDGLKEKSADFTPAQSKNELKKVAELFEPSKQKDCLPPYSLTSEQGVLGCILLSPATCLTECVAKKLPSTAFYDLRHQIVYETLLVMFSESIPIDMLTLIQRLKDKEHLEKVGGFVYVTSLPDQSPSAANLSYYLDIVADKYLLRRAVNTSLEIASKGYSYEGNVSELLDSFERDVLAIRGTVSIDIQSAKDLTTKALLAIEERWTNKGSIGGISTGLIDLDKTTDGMHAGEEIIIAGYEKSGKTSLAMGIAAYVAIDLKLPVGVFSLEMTAEQLFLRLLCSRASVNWVNVRDGFLAERDFPKLTTQSGYLSRAPLYVDDNGDVTINELRAKARRMSQQYGIKLFVIDYLQLLTAPDALKKGNREQEISTISKGVKAMAKELKTPVLLLSQLNNDGITAHSRATQQDCDGLWKLKPIEDEDQKDSKSCRMTLRVELNRHGGTGNVDVVFLKEFTRFENAAKNQDEQRYND